MEKHEYVQALHRETDALLGVARAGLDLPVPSCPGWMVGDVLAHVGQAMNWMREIVESRTQSALRNDPNKHSFDWHRPGVLDWYVESRDRFVTVLGDTDLEEPVWSWAGDNRAVFWLRLEALEAGVHRWDAAAE